MITPNFDDLLALKSKVSQIKRLNSKTSPISLQGSLIAKFKGQGLEFAGVRKYYAGDDVRAIDWRVSARTGSTHIKEFHEEKEVTIDIACDIGPNMQFASFGKFKYLLASEICALLCFAAEQNKEKINGFFYGENLKTSDIFKQKNHKNIALSIIKYLCKEKKLDAINDDNNLYNIVRKINNSSKSNGISFLIASNIEVTKPLYQQLLKLKKRKNIYLCQILDQIESNLPAAGKVNFTDFKGNEVEVDLGNKKARDDYHKSFKTRQNQLEQMCKEIGINLVTIKTTDDPIESLIKALIK